ncbi:MAG: hypothetical protein LBI45_02705 [Bacteroidales bacterium]|jgi:GTP1/Obg family GTP-binding protein|nr:hypothetical protein [Bacteroidales bacterium]
MDAEKAKQDTEKAKQKQAQKEKANKINEIKQKFNDLFGSVGFFTDPAENVRKFYQKLDDDVYVAVRTPSFVQPRTLTQEEVVELAELYQLAVNVIKKVGVKDFNKACKGITTKEKLTVMRKSPFWLTILY